MAPAEPTLLIDIVVGWAPREIQQWQLTVAAGCTIKQALLLSGVLQARPELCMNSLESGVWSVGVWGRREKPGHVLRDHDRIELVRGLIVDPKEARRVRYKANGGRAATEAKRKLLQSQR
jgi:putative ubiquitin-RnfH superfamily antitoxin RatB of RatAB toxin-antitoxin module